MQKIGSNIPEFLNQLSASNPKARLNLRVNQVRARYREALETVYGANAQLFLEHTNNVYIMNKGGIPTLIVYVDDSIFAAELNAQRELIKLKLLELFDEEIEAFEILISRGNYKDNHPYNSLLVSEEHGSLQKELTPLIPLNESEQAVVDDVTASIEDSKLRECFQRAMTADLEWKKGENQYENTKNTK